LDTLITLMREAGHGLAEAHIKVIKVSRTRVRFTR